MQAQSRITHRAAQLRLRAKEARFQFAVIGGIAGFLVAIYLVPADPLWLRVLTIVAGGMAGGLVGAWQRRRLLAQEARLLAMLDVIERNTDEHDVRG